MKPWRKVAVPHKDVLQGTFMQSEFAADLSAVRAGEAPPEYRDAAQFFERTYITEGMRVLLTQVAQRLNGKGGEPVIQLQTAFGGGKTHTMLAVFHLASRKAPLSQLAGLGSVLEAAAVKDVPTARVAVLDGNAHSPGQSWKRGDVEVRTLWGELAWQLGGAAAFAKVKDSDSNGTSPGKQVLQELLAAHAPCVVLVDELVAYVRQFEREKKQSGGTYDSNLSFVQALTEAAKLVPNAVLLASLPESAAEAGSDHGKATLHALEKVFGRVQSIWKPVAAEESFEIVRRRLFEPIADGAARDEVCRAFAEMYQAAGNSVPSVTHESRYLELLRTSYPIHPEVFTRLYEDWSPLSGFQRTRGVLKLMAQVIHRLWSEGNANYLVMPGSLPLADTRVRSELTAHLPAGWDAVLDRDIDAPKSETVLLDTADTRFGEIHAGRRVARTLFLATAPASTGSASTKGIDLPRVLLGCLEPEQSASHYRDALFRLTERMHHLNASGEKDEPGTRFWFDTRATLRREMEDRRNQLEGRPEVQDAMKVVLERALKNAKNLDGSHVFTPHADVLDDGGLRLVVLEPSCSYSRDVPRLAFDAAKEFLKSNGSRPRYRANRLLFLAAEQSSLDRLRVALRTSLAWKQIVDAIADENLVVDAPQTRQAKKESEIAEGALPRIARECFKWLLVPHVEEATSRDVQLEVFELNASGESLPTEIARVCGANELVIEKWSPIHLRTELRKLYWKPEKPHVNALAVWSDMEKYLYLPRLRSRDVFEAAIREGLMGTEFFGAAYGEKDGRYEGLRFGNTSAQLDDTLLLIDPEVAQARRAEATILTPIPAEAPSKRSGRTPYAGSGAVSKATAATATAPAQKEERYYASFDIKAAGAKLALSELHSELLKHFAEHPDAQISLTVDFQVRFPKGATPQLKRVSENADKLGPNVTLRDSGWE